MIAMINYWNNIIIMMYYHSGKPIVGQKFVFLYIKKLNIFVSEYSNKNILCISFQASHSFKNQSKASYLILYHSGVDTQFWAGHYGTKISGSVVKVLLPIKLKCV